MFEPEPWNPIVEAIYMFADGKRPGWDTNPNVRNVIVLIEKPMRECHGQMPQVILSETVEMGEEII